MIALVTGTPGAGKTYYTCKLIADALEAGRPVATNVRLRDDWAERLANRGMRRVLPRGRRKAIERFRRHLIYVETIAELERVRLEPPKGSKWAKSPEGYGLAVFDEASEALQSREFQRDDRLDAIRFFREHRKRLWDVYVIAQMDTMIDSQVRGMAEYKVTLRNLKKLVYFKWLPFKAVFLALWSWHGIKQAKPVRKDWFLLDKVVANLYSTHQLVHDVVGDSGVSFPFTDPSRVGPYGQLLECAAEPQSAQADAAPAHGSDSRSAGNDAEGTEILV